VFINCLTNSTGDKKMLKILRPTLAVILVLCSTSAIFAQNTLIVTDVDPLEGNYSMQLNMVNGTNKAYVQDNSPDFETVYRAEFLFKKNTLALDNLRDRLTILLLRQDLGGGTRITVGRILVIRSVNFGYIGRAAVRKNDSFMAPWQNCGDWTWPTGTGDASIREVVLEWAAATGPGTQDGYCKTTVNGSVKAEVTNIENDERSIDQVWMGATEGNIARTTGEPVFDSFASFRSLSP
jgi:hypothetical protein